MSFPAAFQVPAPFGSDVGPTNAAFFPLNAAVEFDSFLTLGMDGPAQTAGALSSIGIDFSGWESAGIETDDGAVFFMDPGHGKLQDFLAEIALRLVCMMRSLDPPQRQSCGQALRPVGPWPLRS